MGKGKFPPTLIFFGTKLGGKRFRPFPCERGEGGGDILPTRRLHPPEFPARKKEGGEKPGTFVHDWGKKEEGGRGERVDPSLYCHDSGGGKKKKKRTKGNKRAPVGFCSRYRRKGKGGGGRGESIW